MRISLTVVIPLTFFALTQLARADSELSPEDREFFENRIRPVLVERCYLCHNSVDNDEGGLAVDHRNGLLNGGGSGPAIVPGKADESLLIQAIRHESHDLRMPQDDGKLSETIVADFVRWVNLGAPDPRDEPPSAESLAEATSWEAIRERRMKWWSFQPVQDPRLPMVKNQSWSDHPIDQFILAKLEESDLTPAETTSPHKLIRRLSFVLIGLPPTPNEVRDFEDAWERDSEEAVRELVDRLLESERFGERWARHWMDWFRYADSHGSEGDPRVPFAFRYRDYLIRALNQDVPYDRLIREHIAGDLLPDPRIDAAQQINESALGTAHFRMVQHGYSPVDPLDEKVRWVDNQIDVVSKAFLGMTVSCARCHDHKFDPISQKDFYALFGIMGSCRPSTVTIDTPERLDTNRDKLAAVKQQLRQKMAELWLQATDEVVDELTSTSSDVWKDAISFSEEQNAKPNEVKTPLHEWTALSMLDAPTMKAKWEDIRRQHEANKQREAEFRSQEYGQYWDLRSDDYDEWYKHGNGLPNKPSPSGSYAIRPSGDQVIQNIYPAGVYTHLLSNRHNAILHSPDFNVDTDELWFRMAGNPEGERSRIRFAVEKYPRVINLLYLGQFPDGPNPRWRKMDIKFFSSDEMYVELSTGQDIPVEIASGPRSWFGVTEVVCLKRDQPKPKDYGATLVALTDETPTTKEQLASQYAEAIRECVEAWRDETMTDEQALFLGYFVRQNLLPNTISQISEQAMQLVNEYRSLEDDVPVPTRAPGLLETIGRDQPLFVRGNHKNPSEPVSRRFLEAFDSKPYDTELSGRLELANDIANGENPLVRRVIANRIWHHVFGRGIVSTCDNFGHLGEKPTHPELLDHLATKIVDENWSLKSLIKYIVLSKTFQQSAKIRPNSAPELLSYFPPRRLEAEVIRDSLLAVSGIMSPAMYGDGDGGRGSRRSVYVSSIRNNLDPFLQMFDAPEPYATVGRRASTNVPAQSLALLNDPFVIDRARNLADRVIGEHQQDDERIQSMFASAFSRPATDEELEQSRAFLAFSKQQSNSARQRLEQLQAEIAEKQSRVRDLIEPVREKLRAKLESGESDQEPLPDAMAIWDFEGDLSDAVGNLHGRLHGQAKLEDGAIALDGTTSYVSTPPIQKEIKEKTLEAWVQLKTLDQGGGGVISIQTTDGVIFDSIVYAERQRRRWMAGSNGFVRTSDFNGTSETEATDTPVHYAITYKADGTITGYRNGVQYGRSYKKSDLQTYPAGRAQIIFGLRHGTSGGPGRTLAGRVLRAKFYDRALTEEQVAASAADDRTYVPFQHILAAMTDAHRTEYDQLKKETASLSEELKVLESQGTQFGPNRPWQDLALCFFNLKEFIYLD